MMVVCSVCGKAGKVHFDKARNTTVFRCGSCYAARETLSCGRVGFEVTAQCTTTGRYFRIPMSSDRIHGQKARIKCSFCEKLVIEDVSDNRNQYIVFEDIRHAEDPYFHYLLYFQASYRGRIIRALNREQYRKL